MKKALPFSHHISLQAVMFILLFALLLPGAMAHSGDEITTPLGETPTIDGSITTGEWDDASSVTVTINVEGVDAEIFFKHDRDNVYFAFDIQEGHNSAFPDTRVYLDLLHDAADAPQEDDYQLYINPDNGDLQERQGDGSGWQQVTISNWTGDYEEVDTGHWTTEYSVSRNKLGLDTGDESFGVAFMVYGNLPGAFAMWPDTADGDDPSTWADILFSDWKEPVTSRPTAEIMSISPEKQTLNETVTFTGAAGENDSVARYVWNSSLDGEFYNGSDYRFETNNLSLGEHDIALMVQNTDGVWSNRTFAELEVVEGKVPQGPGEGDDDDDDGFLPGFGLMTLALSFLLSLGLSHKRKR